MSERPLTVWFTPESAHGRPATASESATCRAAGVTGSIQRRDGVRQAANLIERAALARGSCRPDAPALGWWSYEIGGPAFAPMSLNG